MPIYMQFEGIDGDVDSEGHEKWIELENIRLEVSRNITPAGNSGREISTPAVSEIVITKNHDSASTDLFRDSLSGTPKKVVIHYVRTGEKPQVYYEIDLEKCLISSYSVGKSLDKDGAPQPRE